MKVTRRMKLVKAAVALATVLALSGTGWAKKGGGGPGLSGDLDGDTVTVTLTIPTSTDSTVCPDTPISGATYHVKARIYQPSGRLLGIASGQQVFTCNNSQDQEVIVVMQVFPGLTLKPGPATILFRAIETVTTTTATGTTTDREEIYEFGSRVDLH